MFYREGSHIPRRFAAGGGIVSTCTRMCLSVQGRWLHEKNAENASTEFRKRKKTMTNDR